MFHGQGILAFNGISVSSNRWYLNLVEEEAQKPELKNPEKGYYLICPNKVTEKADSSSLMYLKGYKIFLENIRSKKALYIINCYLI